MPSFKHFRVLLVLVFFYLLWVSAEEQHTLVAGNETDHHELQQPLPPTKTDKDDWKQPQLKQFDMFLSSERRVPNASDPLHNR
ncbi:hypothetical protein LINPERPRIM_LOCUS15343 [Linum perenne]